MIQDFQQTTMAYCVMQLAALPPVPLQTNTLLLLLVTDSLTDADICPLAHPPLHKATVEYVCPGEG